VVGVSGLEKTLKSPRERDEQEAKRFVSLILSKSFLIFAEVSKASYFDLQWMMRFEQTFLKPKLEPM
jgi:predicted transcriptional regulator